MAQDAQHKVPAQAMAALCSPHSGQIAGPAHTPSHPIPAQTPKTQWQPHGHYCSVTHKRLRQASTSACKGVAQETLTRQTGESPVCGQHPLWVLQRALHIGLAPDACMLQDSTDKKRCRREPPNCTECMCVCVCAKQRCSSQKPSSFVAEEESGGACCKMHSQHALQTICSPSCKDAQSTHSSLLHLPT